MFHGPVDLFLGSVSRTWNVWKKLDRVRACVTAALVYRSLVKVPTEVTSGFHCVPLITSEPTHYRAMEIIFQLIDHLEFMGNATWLQQRHVCNINEKDVVQKYLYTQIYFSDITFLIFSSCNSNRNSLTLLYRYNQPTWLFTRSWNRRDLAKSYLPVAIRRFWIWHF